MSEIVIEWLSDEMDCETCGSDWAGGARVTVDGKIALQLIPLAHCFNGRHYEEREVFTRILRHLGHAVSDASVDTHPKDGDVKQAPAPLSGAVAASETPKGDHP